VVEKVQVTLTVNNVNFDALNQNQILRNGFVAAVKRSVAQQAGGGVTPADVAVELSAGSVRVRATIIPPAATTSTSLTGTLASGSASLSTSLLNELSSVSGIGTVASGSLAVTGLSVVRVSVPTPSPAPMPPSGMAGALRGTTPTLAMLPALLLGWLGSWA